MRLVHPSTCKSEYEGLVVAIIVGLQLQMLEFAFF